MSGHETLKQHVPGAWRVRGWRNKGRGRGITVASRAGQSETSAWIVRYSPQMRDAARRKLAMLDATAPPEYVAALARAAGPFVPYRRERRARTPQKENPK
jgi:hypothetical protein